MTDSKPHPTFAELLALSVDELPPRRADEIREHLLDCPTCLAEVRELLRLPEAPPSPEGAISDADQALAWQRLSAALDAAEAGAEAEKPQPFRVLPSADSSKPTTAPAAPARTRLQRPSGWLLAAALAAAVGSGLLAGRFMARSEAEGAAITAIKARSFLVRGQPEPPTEAECPPAGGTFVFTLLFTQRPADAKTAEVAIVDKQGKVWHLSPKQIDEEGEVQLTLPWHSLQNGDYVLKVSAQSDEGKAVREEFPVSVACK